MVSEASLIGFLDQELISYPLLVLLVLVEATSSKQA